MAYVIVTVRFHCPCCNQSGSEQVIIETEIFDSEETARTLSRQPFECQNCFRTLPDGTGVNAHAELATPTRLTELGFASSRTN
jgi:hypothetical protein